MHEIEKISVFAVAVPTENGKRNRRTKQEQRVLAHYALQEGGKACAAGLKRKTFPTTTSTNDLRRFEQTERGCCNRRLLGLADGD